MSSHSDVTWLEPHPWYALEDPISLYVEKTVLATF